ncbi:hypothetical protein AB0M46_13545 [Dactylosporangium sp. NPDC051485]|uniref:hypothetical protein n=1 Tax=Dactylosporangium sp. NPDC051485 TaxID=3154846 RepID=UPI00341BECCB
MSTTSTPIRLATLTAAQRAALRPDDRIVIADGTIHRLGTVITEQKRGSGIYIKLVARSLTADCWLNLHTGYPAHDPRADADLDRVAHYYDLRELAADLPAARVLAEHLRRTEPERYAATLTRLTAQDTEQTAPTTKSDAQRPTEPDSGLPRYS